MFFSSTLNRLVRSFDDIGGVEYESLRLIAPVFDMILTFIFYNFSNKWQLFTILHYLIVQKYLCVYYSIQSVDFPDKIICEEQGTEGNQLMQSCNNNNNSVNYTKLRWKWKKYKQNITGRHLYSINYLEMKLMQLNGC